jgi:hypothetical protein
LNIYSSSARLIAKDKEIQENYDKTRTSLTNETIYVCLWFSDFDLLRKYFKIPNVCIDQNIMKNTLIFQDQ